MAGVAESRASAEEIQSSGLMLLLLKSFGMLWAWNGPPAGSEKHPRDAKPWIAEVMALAVEVTSVDVAMLLDVEPGLDEIFLELLETDDDIKEVAEEDALESVVGDLPEPDPAADPGTEIVEVDNGLEPEPDSPGIESGPGTYFVRS